MIICDEGGIGANEYEDILYDGLFSLIDDVLVIPEDVEEVQIANENSFIFMHDLPRCSSIHRRAWKHDIDMARLCRRFGILREWRWWRR